MRYALVSDIHANWQAWKAVLDDIEKAGVDGVICLGDIVGYGPQPAKVLESVYEASDLFLLGNHDAVICGRFDSECFNDEAKIIIDWTAGQLNDSAVDFFNQVPMMVLGDEFACSHAEFAIPERYDYIYDPHEAVESLAATEQPLLFVGHTHYPGTIRASQDGKLDYFKPQNFSLQQDSRYLVNVGSVGDPRNGDIRASYCIYDLEKNTIEFRNVPFDIDEFRLRIAQAGIPTKPILFDYAGRPIGSEADVAANAEASKIRDFHVNEDVVKAAAGNVSSVERITESGIHNRAKIQISAGTVGDGVAFRSAQAAQQRAAREAAQKQKKLMAIFMVTTLCVLVVAISAYFIIHSGRKGDPRLHPDNQAHVVTDTPETNSSTPAQQARLNSPASTNRTETAPPHALAATKVDPLTWIKETSTVFALVPSAENGGSKLGEQWRLVADPENIAQWKTGMNGVGYETKPGDYAKLINVALPEMAKKNPSCYIRIPFTTPDLKAHSDLNGLLLDMRFDDGYIAYLNGTKIAEMNAPATPAWNAEASETHDDKLAINYEAVDISQHIELLQIGTTNLLAIHGLNKKSTSSDLLIMPRFRSKTEAEIAQAETGAKAFESIIRKLAENTLSVSDAIEQLATLRSTTKDATLLDDIDQRRVQLEIEQKKGISAVMADLSNKAKQLESQNAPEQAARVYNGYTGPYAAETAATRKSLAAPLVKQQAEIDAIVASFNKQVTQMLLEQRFEEAFTAYADNQAEFPDLGKASAYKQLASELDHILPAHEKIMDSFENQKGQEVKLRINNHDVLVRIEGVDKSGYLVVRPHTGDSYASPSPLPLYRISIAERLNRMGTDSSPGAEFLRGIMYAHAGEVKTAGEYLAKSKLKIGTAIKSKLGNIDEQRKEEHARKTIDGLKQTMGITARTANADQMRMMIYSRSQNRTILQTYQQRAAEIKKAFAATKSYKEEEEFFTLVESLTPLVNLRPLKDPVATYPLSRNTLSSDRKLIGDTSSKRINLSISGAAKFQRTEFGELLYFDGQKTALSSENKSPIPREGSFTVTFWSKPKKTSGLSGIFAAGNRDNGFQSLSIGYENDHYALRIPGVKIDARKLPKVKYDVWHFNIVRYHAKKIEWKVSTRSDITFELARAFSIADKLRIGVAPNSKNESVDHYKGYLKDLFFYDRAISDAEVKHLLDQIK